MGTYTFYVHTVGEAVPSFRLVECSDDQAALEVAAAELRFSRTADRVEVVTGDREVATVRRPGADGSRQA